MGVNKNTMVLMKTKDWKLEALKNIIKIETDNYERGGKCSITLNYLDYLKRKLMWYNLGELAGKSLVEKESGK